MNWKETLFKGVLKLGQSLPASVRLALTQSSRFAWLRRLSLIPTDKGSVVMALSAPLAGYRMRLEVRGGHRRFALGTYEPQIASLLQSQIKKKAVVMDVGANIGYFTLLMADLVGEMGRVIAFEPAPKVFASLCENLSLNQCDWVRAEQIALADIDGQGYMRAEIDHAFSFIGQLAADGNVSVTLATLDNYVALANLKQLDFIKIDVEGAEDRLARGMIGTLETLHPSLLVEIHRDDEQESEILALLNRAGYKLVRFEANQWVPCDTQARSGHVFAV